MVSCCSGAVAWSAGATVWSVGAAAYGLVAAAIPCLLNLKSSELTCFMRVWY